MTNPIKYKTINGWTKDKMKAQVRAKNNGHRSTKAGGCAYESTDGNRCAAGCFIPDGHAALGYGDFIDMLIARYPELANYMPLEFNHDMYKFQLAHDTASDEEDVREVLCEWIDKNVEDAS